MNDKNIIEDIKLEYLIRTLSRTNKKDYENYVINSIWNRLDNDKIEIVSQQYIYNPKDKRKYYFIDLYFPALNIGIECDEAHHLNDKNIVEDKKRYDNIKEALRKKIVSLYYEKIDYEKYIQIKIDVTKSFDEVNSQINDAVRIIKEKISEVNPAQWILDANDYFKTKDVISVKDRIGFKTINNVCNVLFSTTYRESGGRRSSFFTPGTFKNTEYKNYKVWFPKLAIEEDGETKAATDTGWNNQIINNGKEIIEGNDNSKPRPIGKNEKIRITFAKYKDPLGNDSYRFVGIFEFDDDYKSANGERHFILRKDECKLIRKASL